MKKEIGHFGRKLLLFAGFIAGLTHILLLTPAKEFYLPVFPFIILFFAIGTFGIHSFMLKAGQQRPAVFSTKFMAVTGIKLFVLTVFAGIYIFIDRSNAIPFLLFFVLNYLIFTIFETVSILSELNQNTINKK